MLRLADHPRYVSADLDAWRLRLRVLAPDLPDAVVREIIRVAGPALLQAEEARRRRVS
jgi:hypothetical protein